MNLACVPNSTFCSINNNIPMPFNSISILEIIFQRIICINRDIRTYILCHGDKIRFTRICDLPFKIEISTRIKPIFISLTIDYSFDWQIPLRFQSVNIAIHIACC